MPEKQLNFVHIFDEAEAEKKTADEVLRQEKESAELAEMEEKNIERQRLINDSEAEPDDFQIFCDEIDGYYGRIKAWRQEFKNPETSFEEKSRIHAKLAQPEIFDEPEFRDSARLYLKYLEVIKASKQKQSQAPAKENERLRKIKKIDKTKLGLSGRDRAVAKFE